MSTQAVSQVHFGGRLLVQDGPGIRVKHSGSPLCGGGGWVSSIYEEVTCEWCREMIKVSMYKRPPPAGQFADVAKSLEDIRAAAAAREAGWGFDSPCEHIRLQEALNRAVERLVRLPGFALAVERLKG